MAGKNGKTRPFTAVNYSAAKLAREKQRREYEQQKKEKLIFALFVVIILIMILFAILIFKKALGDDSDPAETDTQTAEAPDTDSVGLPSAYESTVLAKSDIYTGDLLLIDPSHPYKATEALTLENLYGSRKKFDTGVYSFYTAGIDGDLEKETLAALNAMTDAFYEATGNSDLYVHTTNGAYVEGVDDEHATGRAVDLSVYTSEKIRYSLEDPSISDDFDWVKENYYKYGFIRRECDSACRLDEPYHLLYVGVAHAYYMHKNDLSLEEYVEKLRAEHVFANEGEDNLVFTAEDGSRYEVYYVAAAGDMVTLPIYADNDSYTVSGDNAGGFIVTIKHK